VTQVVVAKIAPGGVDAVVARLEEGGIEAHVVDRPGSLALLVAFGTYRVRIAVEEEDEARARAVLALWGEEARPRVERLARIVVLDLLLAAIPAILVGAGFVLSGTWRRPAFGLSLLGTWFAGALLLACRRRRRSAPSP